jgi:hypothetical protein
MSKPHKVMKRATEPTLNKPSMAPKRPPKKPARETPLVTVDATPQPHPIPYLEFKMVTQDQVEKEHVQWTRGLGEGTLLQAFWQDKRGVKEDGVRDVYGRCYSSSHVS